jgi:putative transposase
MPGRKHPAHFIPCAAGDRPDIIFVTAVTQHRQRCLANPDAHRLLRETWAAASHWQVGRYVVMPDHVHFFSTPGNEDCPLEKWMHYWKSQLSKAWPVTVEKPVFQRDHWDRQLRREESYDQKWNYVRENPVRAGLTERQDDWPYQGVLNDLRW